MCTQIQENASVQPLNQHCFICVRSVLMEIVKLLFCSDINSFKKKYISFGPIVTVLWDFHVFLLR